MRETAIALAFAFFASGCDTGSAASPVFESTPGQAEAGEAGFAVCPPEIDASFGSIYTQMLATPGCGSNMGQCHATTDVNGLAYTFDGGADAAAVYAELLGDGGGVLADNIAGTTAGVLRVVPFDAGASMLYIKLTLDSGANLQYGSGMPQNAPGSVCPAAVSAVEAWINSGAAFVPTASDAGALDADAGPTVDATLD